MPPDPVNFVYFNQKNYKALSRSLIPFVPMAGLELDFPAWIFQVLINSVDLPPWLASL